jgi:glycosyltransferase involved in cell wall biosynthesis
VNDHSRTENHGLVIQADSSVGRALAECVTWVAILLDSAPRTWTSMEEINFRLSRNLTALGIRVVLVYAAALPPELDRRMRQAGASIEVVPYGKDRYRFYREIGRIIKAHSVSMVHVCFFDYFSLVPWLTRLQGMRCIIYEELNSGMLNATSWKKRLLQLRTVVTTFPMTRVIAVSDFVKQDLIKRGISARRIAVRHLGADETRFKPDPAARQRWAAEYSISRGELIMSSVTLLRPFKSPETLVEACAGLARRGVAARLFVAGDGAMLDDLKALSRRLGTEDRIHWLGFCGDPTSLMQASDLFLLASVGEAGGFVLSEAMGCGVPIVGSRSGVISECVEEGRTGLLARPKDPESFANAIQSLSADESLRSIMSANSRVRMLQRFTVDINVQRTLSLYASVWTK